jgi:hypothetical protein
MKNTANIATLSKFLRLTKEAEKTCPIEAKERYKNLIPALEKCWLKREILILI